MNIPIGPGIPEPINPALYPTAQPHSLSLAQRVGNLGKSIISAAADSTIATLSKPLSAIKAVAAWVGWRGVYDAPAEAKKILATAHGLCQERRWEDAEKSVKDYCRNFLARHPLPSGTWSESCTNHLIQKLILIAVDSNIPLSSKEQIVLQVQEDFLNLISEATQRLAQDKDAGALERLGITREDSLLEVQCCGSETHNQGKLVLKFVFSGGQEIIYKPRSMLPEATLCARDDSVFQEAGFGTYDVVCRQDAHGAYGYAERLHNIKERNTMHTVEEVQQYMDRMVLLDAIGQRLRISDLHYQNIITVDKDPKAIDLEVYLGPIQNPEHFQTCVFGLVGAANTFDPSGGSLQETNVTNQIWFDPSLTTGRNVNFSYEMSSEHLEQIGVRIHPSDDVALSPILEEKITLARQTLQAHPGRFVLIDTLDLKNMLVCLDPEDTQQEAFIEKLQRSLENFGFQFNSAAQSDVVQAIRKDILHNDVPIFFYDSINQHVLYHGIVIGTRA